MPFLDLTPEEQAYSKVLIQELEGYAGSRMNDVKRNAETPELAALLVEKYGLGMAKAIHLLDFKVENFDRRIKELVKAIDPDADENREKRWKARPAGLSLKYD